MVLNGIGGRTIAEAQKALSYAEYLKWVAFINKRGSLHTGMRVEASAALLATLYANAHSKTGGFTPADFMSHIDHQAASLEQAMKEWV